MTVIYVRLPPTALAVPGQLDPNESGSSGRKKCATARRSSRWTSGKGLDRILKLGIYSGRFPSLAGGPWEENSKDKHGTMGSG